MSVHEGNIVLEYEHQISILYSFLF